MTNIRGDRVKSLSFEIMSNAAFYKSVIYTVSI